VGFLKDEFAVSERRSCRVLEAARSSCQYKAAGREADGLAPRMRELAVARPRFGYRRLHVLLRRDGWCVNHKKVWRIYREEGLAVRRRKRKKLAVGTRVIQGHPQRANQLWAMDFVSDSLATGRKFRTLNIVDAYTRECLAIEADTSLPGERVARVLDQVAITRDLPEVIVTDNGPEFAGTRFEAWALQKGVKVRFIRPGKPVENALVESFNGKFRDECLNESWFTTLADARERIEQWRVDYNRARPHSSPGNLSPEQFAASAGLSF
jgi:putative transposase